MKLNPINWLFDRSPAKDPVLLAVTPPRTGERTLLGVENLLQSIAVPDLSRWSWLETPTE